MKVLKIQEDIYVMVSDISCFTILNHDDYYTIFVHCICEPEGYGYEDYATYKEAEDALSKLVSRIGNVIE
jgi:hypothetical protein